MRTAEEFWEMVRKSKAGCWTWRDARLNGYGRVFWHGKIRYAHRVAWEIANGTPPPRRTKAKDTCVILHSCDNTLCVNPAHLSLGTMADNMRQRSERGRQRAPRGETHPKAKLTEADVRTIKFGLAAGVFQRTLAGMFGVSQVAISLIAGGKNWSHVTIPPPGQPVFPVNV